jgi:hypothetical protein
LEKREINSPVSPVIVAKVQSGEIVVAGDLTIPVARGAIVMPVPAQAQQGTPVDGPEWHPRASLAEIPQGSVRLALVFVVHVSP